MFYYLFEYINNAFNPPGFDVFRFITFRAAAAAITALLISWIVGHVSRVVRGRCRVWMATTILG